MIGALTRQDPLTLNSWADALLPAGRFLAGPAVEVLGRQSSSPTVRALAASLAVRFGAGDSSHVPAEKLSSAILECDIESRRILMPAIESATLQVLKERADDDAIQVFAQNLRELLLAALEETTQELHAEA